MSTTTGRRMADPMATDRELALKSINYRRELLRIIKAAGAGHTGGSLSCVDIISVLYNRILRVSPAAVPDPDRDRYVQSKGHSVEALYVVLADLGFFPRQLLDTLGGAGSHFVGHPTRKVPGIEHNTGALGHGLPVAVGMALGARLRKSLFRTFVLMGDGELAEGSNWEAAMAASHYRLDSLTAVIDCNSLQISGRTSAVMNSEPIDAKFAAFGWAVSRVDGHDLAALSAELGAPPAPGRPRAIIASTVKGKGVSFMEDAAGWHHGVPNDEQYARAMAELDAGLAALEGDAT
jgi:transketolase